MMSMVPSCQEAADGISLMALPSDLFHLICSFLSIHEKLLTLTHLSYHLRRSLNAAAFNTNHLSLSLAAIDALVNNPYLQVLLADIRSLSFLRVDGLLDRSLSADKQKMITKKLTMLLSFFSLSSRLTSINCTFPDGPAYYNSRLISLLLNMPHIQTLTVSGASNLLWPRLSIYRGVLQACKQKNILSYVSTMNLSQLAIDNNVLGNLLRRMPQLQSICLHRCRLITGEIIGMIGANCPTINKISITECNRLTLVSSLLISQHLTNLPYQPFTELKVLDIEWYRHDRIDRSKDLSALTLFIHSIHLAPLEYIRLSRYNSQSFICPEILLLSIFTRLRSLALITYQWTGGRYKQAITNSDMNVNAGCRMAESVLDGQIWNHSNPLCKYTITNMDTGNTVKYPRLFNSNIVDEKYELDGRAAYFHHLAQHIMNGSCADT